MLVKVLKGLKNALNPNYWAERIGEPARIPASRNDVECQRRTPRMNFELFILPPRET